MTDEENKIFTKFITALFPDLKDLEWSAEGLSDIRVDVTAFAGPPCYSCHTPQHARWIKSFTREQLLEALKS